MEEEARSGVTVRKNREGVDGGKEEGWGKGNKRREGRNKRRVKVREQ